MNSPVVLPDRAARDAIEADLHTDILVEAGAGSGKTTALVGRMVALVRSGVDVERVAAVTFTRKAAGELRERFQGALEEARRKAGPESDERARLDTALRAVDRAFMGTIHAFCARLLRERPLEAGLDPAFTELTAQETVRLSSRWWSVWLERLAADGDPSLGELEDVGLTPQQLEHGFTVLGEYTDVDFPAPPVPRPDPSEIRALRTGLESLMDEAEAIFPAEEPEKEWGDFQSALRTAWFMRRALDWDDDRVFLDAAAVVQSKVEKIRLNRWFPAPKDQGPIKALRESARAWGGEGSPGERLVRRWMAHRYPVALGFARRAATEFARFRRRTGHLSFHDLLVLTAELLRRSPGARRDLGERYRHLLVDEFQDTDPLQAEVLFLLASEPQAESGGGSAAEDGAPGEGDGATDADWTTAVPRPGALFVVGDPKQSIYRFRRADIALYQQVRERFDADHGGFGRVLRLTANFRSRPPVAALVNAVFDDPDRFPPEPTEHQAAFAPLEPQRAEEHPGEGVYLYEIPPCDDPGVSGRGREKPERDTESQALAGWIRERVERGERRPGDFLILTRTKRALDVYARALEERNLPVAVSGAGVGIEEELAELETVLRALADPDDEVATVAALVGLFFGLDMEELLSHRERQAAARGHAVGAFDFRRWDPVAAGDWSEASAEDPVGAALGTLHRWWRRARHLPADVVVAELVDELGLLPWAAAGDLGAVRAGALAFALDAVRGAGLDGDTSLTGALEALHTALGEDEAEAPLEPEREEAVRVMNLHKAKGLEAEVVILVDPYQPGSGPTRVLVERDAAGAATGWMRVGEPGSWGQLSELAVPLEWPEKEAEEARFGQAEETRLLYVAATRAGQELVVTRCGERKRADKSAWTPFHPWLDAHATPLELDAEPPPPRERLATPAPEIARRAEAVREARIAAGRPDFAFETVTALAKGHDTAGEAADASTAGDEALDLGEDRPGWELAFADSSGPGGFEWGSAVHAALEAAGRDPGTDPRAAARTALLENDRPVTDGEPTELDVLVELVERVVGHPLWQEARAAPRRLVEHPFTLETAPGRYLEGVVDLAFRDEGGWTVVDYKTDRGEDPDFPDRRVAYRRQIRLYGEALARLTGEPITRRLLWFVRGGDVEEVPEG